MKYGGGKNVKRPYAIICILLTIVLVAAGCSGIPFFKKGQPKEDEAVKEDTEEQAEAEETETVEEEPEETEIVEEEEEPAEDENNEDISLGDYTIYLGGELAEEEDKILIFGESNLIPEARVVGEVFVGDEDEPVYFSDTSEKVQDDGTFYMELSHPQKDNIDEIKVQVKFHFDTQQSDEVIRHYGDRGQKLEGPYIYKHQRELGGRSNQDIYNMAKVTASFEPGEDTLAVTQFKEPKWYTLPDDMGDTRVWLEVDEINNDKEHYYLHGRSNLIEGSKLKVEYGANFGTAFVQPDGSFDFKIDYEYKEDTPFVILFKPNDFQWNMVEEVYGMEYQNLVGNCRNKQI